MERNSTKFSPQNGCLGALDEWDSRHRSIIGRLNRIVEKARRQPGCDLSGELDQLVNETLRHIVPEESFMELVAFPMAREHSIRHRSISIDTAKLRYRLEKREDALPDELDRIRLMWLEHIEVHDRAFELFLTSRG